MSYREAITWIKQNVMDSDSSMKGLLVDTKELRCF